MVVPYFATNDEQGAFVIAFASTDPDYATSQLRLRADPNGIAYPTYVDGKELVYEGSDAPSIVIFEGSEMPVGFLTAGTHHVVIGNIAAPIFESDAQFAAGTVTHLYLYGPAAGLLGTFISDPITPAAGTERVSAINLVLAGQQIELVSCTNASTCTPVSMPLALGQSFTADLPADAGATAGSAGGQYSLTDAGVGIGYRQVATAAVPSPPVLPLFRGVNFASYTSSANRPAYFVAAPIFMAADGQVQASFQ
jgi:hypothetical protein